MWRLLGCTVLGAAAALREAAGCLLACAAVAPVSQRPWQLKCPVALRDPCQRRRRRMLTTAGAAAANKEQQRNSSSSSSSSSGVVSDL